MFERTGYFVRSTYFSAIDPKYRKIQQLILSDLQKFTQIVLKFKTQVSQVLNFRTISVNF
jgi:hypothetical protein